MVTPVIKNTFLTSYRDDWKDSDNYHRILFNNGRALQARELTQMQTILQNQITKNGNFLFNDGTPVAGGSIYLTIAAEFVKLNTAVYTLPTDTSTIVGDTFTGATSGIKVRVNRVVPAEGTDPATLYISYIDNNGQVSADTTLPLRLRVNETLTGAVSGVTLKVQSVDTALNPCVGRGSIVSANAGTYYIAGHYVFADQQTLIFDKYSTTPSGNVGFIAIEDIVTASDNSALYDNSGPNPNLSAPGADRYRIRLVLTKESDVDSGDAYFNVVTIDNGYIVQQVNENAGNMLATLGDIMATRTYEESGNYVVRPFIINAETNADSSSKLDINIGPGLAYVQGYRVATTGNLQVTVPKPRSTTLFNNQATASNYGNYITVSTLRGIPTIDTLAPVNLRSAITYGGATIGTARVRAIEKNGANYNLYLFDVAMTTGQSFRDVRSIGTSVTKYGNLILQNGIATLTDASNNNLFFNLPRNRPSELTDIVITTQRLFTGTTDGTGSVTLTAGTNEVFDDASSWITAVDSSGNIQNPVITINSPYTSAVMTNLPFTSNVTIAAYVQKNIGSVRSKTLTNRAATFTPGVGGLITLDRADVYRINAVKLGSVAGEDISSRYTFFNGQNDNYYDLGTLRLKANKPAPVGLVYVDFDFFAHGASGNFFAVNSYTGQIPYEDIPSHTQANGDIVPLREVLDFRPRKANSGLNFTSVGFSRMELPKNTDLVTFDARYYNSQRGMVSIHADGLVSVLMGDPSATNPKYPAEPANTITQYRFTLNPYMISDDDMISEYTEHRHYSMADIGKIENRLDRLEEFTTLSLLELATANIKVYDSSGVDRLKAGFTADNFISHAFSDTDRVEYKASIDFNKRELRPEFVQRSIELVYDDAASTNTTLVGDTVYMDYTSVEWKNHLKASRAESVTAFEISKMVGDIKLSPASDVWFDEFTKPKRTINGGSDLDVSGTRTWAGWNGNWSGWTEDEIANLKVGDDLNTSTVASDTIRTYTSDGYKYYVRDRIRYTNEVQSSYIVKTPGPRIVTQSSIPYQRSRFVFFKATNLRPNTRFFAFYGGKDITSWFNCNTAFSYFGSLTRGSPYLEAGNQYSTATGFPASLGGPTNIVTDASGAVDGVFLIPNTESLKFATGSTDLVLIDISVLNYDTAISYAQTQFTTSGVLYTYQDQEISTRVLKVVTVSENIDPVVVSKTKVVSNNNSGGSGGSDRDVASPYVTVYSPTQVYSGTAKEWAEIKNGGRR